MACIRERRNRYVLDYRDITGKRRWQSFPLTEAGKARADAALAKIVALTPGSLDPGVRVSEYITYWLELVQQRSQGMTWRTYQNALTAHVPSALLRMRVMDVSRSALKVWAASLVSLGLAKATVVLTLRVMSSMLSDAVDDGLLAANPALRLSRRLGIERKDQVRAMTSDQRERFLAVARGVDLWPAIAVLTYAGLRGGEARGLQLDDVDLDAGKLTVARQVYDTGKVGPTKRAKVREVDISPILAEVLREQIAKRRAEDLRRGRRTPWLLFSWFSEQPTGRESLMAVNRMRRALLYCLETADLPHFTPHSLRHTFATLMLARGEGLLYVARQLGDTLPITAEVYGRHAKIPGTAGGTAVLDRGKN